MDLNLVQWQLWHTKLRKVVASQFHLNGKKHSPNSCANSPPALKTRTAAKTWTSHNPPCEIGSTQAFTPEGAVLAWRHSPLLLRFLLMSRVPAELLPSSGTSTRSAVCRDRNSKWDRISQKKGLMKWNKTTARVFGKCGTWVVSEQSRVSLWDGRKHWVWWCTAHIYCTGSRESPERSTRPSLQSGAQKISAV